MTYTPNTPQATQTIAFTQPLIQANFTFLDGAIDQEHNFDVTDETATYHKQASMPNRADPVSLPAGTNGMYYVSGAVPKFYNSAAQFIQLTTIPYKLLTGTANVTTGGVNIVAIPANSVGQYYLFKKSTNNTVNSSSATGLFATDNTTLFLARTSEFDPGITVADSGLTWQAATTNPSFNGTYTYLVVYFNP